MKCFIWILFFIVMLPVNAQTELTQLDEKKVIEELPSSQDEIVESKSKDLFAHPSYADIKSSAEFLSPKIFDMEAIKKIPSEKRAEIFKELQTEVRIGTILNKDDKLHKVVGYTERTVILKDLRTGEISEVGDEPFFLLLCAAGGPVVFGGCLTIALILLSTAAY